MYDVDQGIEFCIPLFFMRSIALTKLYVNMAASDMLMRLFSCSVQ